LHAPGNVHHEGGRRMDGLEKIVGNDRTTRVITKDGNAHLVEQYRVPGTSAYVIVPLCRNGGLDLRTWTIQPIANSYRGMGDGSAGHKMCKVCLKASHLSVVPLGENGRALYEWVMGKAQTQPA
jgi:hypothetical protein